MKRYLHKQLLTESMLAIVEGTLREIKDELEKHIETKSPFDNSKTEYKTDVFTVRAYDPDRDYEPNFHYEKDGVVLEVFWVKQFGYKNEAISNARLTNEFFNIMRDDCLKAIKER